MKLIKIQYRGKNRENIKERLRYKKDRIKKIHHSVERDPEGEIIENEETKIQTMAVNSPEMKEPKPSDCSRYIDHL